MHEFVCVDVCVRVFVYGCGCVWGVEWSIVNSLPWITVSCCAFDYMGENTGLVTGQFTVGREGAHCSTASTVCVPSTELLERALCQLLETYSRLEVSATRSQITSGFDVHSHCRHTGCQTAACRGTEREGPPIVTALVQSQIVNESLAIHYFAVVPT